MSDSTDKPAIATLCRQRYADIVRGLYARFSLALQPDAKFHFAQPYNPLASPFQNEVRGVLLAFVEYGKNDVPQELATTLTKEDAYRPPVVNGALMKLHIAVPEGLFVVKVLGVARS